MSRPCPRCGVPAPVVVSSDGALPPELVMADQVSRLREALERIRAVHASGVGDIGKARRMDDIARAALAAGKREGG